MRPALLKNFSSTAYHHKGYSESNSQKEIKTPIVLNLKPIKLFYIIRKKAKTHRNDYHN